MRRLLAAVSIVLAIGVSAPVASANATVRPRPAPTLIVHGLKVAQGIHYRLTRPQHMTPRAVVQSPTWAGYAAVACKTCALRFVEANFNVPSVHSCTPGTSGNAAVSHWVGLDGANNTTVEQAGVLAICNGSTVSYFGFYELFPQPAVLFTGISPGDAIDADVFFNSATGNYNLDLSDVATGGFFHATKTCPGGSVCKNASAEVITEVPNGGPPDVNLANYGMVNYGNVVVTSLNGTRATLAANGRTWSSTEFIMANSATKDTLSTPSSLYAGQAFSVSWNNAS